MNNNEKNVTIVNYDCTVTEMVDIIRKYKNELLLLIESDKLKTLKSIVELFINHYNSEYKKDIDKMVKQTFEIQYLYTLKNKPYCMLEVFEDYIECILLQGIMDESNADEIIYILKNSSVLDVEIRKQSTSFEDYWVRWLAEMRSDSGKQILDLMVQMTINMFTNENVINALSTVSNEMVEGEQGYDYWIGTYDRIIEALETKF